MINSPLPRTEEEAINLINTLRVKTSKPGQAVLIDTSIPIHLHPVRLEEDYLDEISWRSALLKTLGGEDR